MKRLLLLVALLLGLSLSVFAQTQSKLPPCPAVDYLKKGHVGVGGRTEKWHNCYGRYVAELDDLIKGSFYEGEFQNGIFHGQGTFTEVNGNKYDGEWNKNKMIFGGLGAALFFYLIRNQAFVTERQYLRGMIPHHSMEIMMSKRLTNSSIQPLLDQIIESQEKEIILMIQYLNA